MSGPTLLLLFSWLNTTPGTELTNVVAIRENVIQLQFADPVTFTFLGDASDSATASKYAVTPVAGTVGLDGTAVQAVSVVSAAPSESLPAGVSSGIDLTLDRPMTPFPARYSVAATNVYVNGSPGNFGMAFPAVFKQVNPIQLDFARPLKDFANPQTPGSTVASVPTPLQLATFAVDDTGDYAIDEGVPSLKKRIWRRLMTRRGGFLHMPDYGVGVPDFAKKLNLASVRARLAAEAEAQISLEPEVARVSVTIVSDAANNGVARFRVLVKTRDGMAARFDVPVPLSG